MNTTEPLIHTDPPCEACRIEGTGPYSTPKDTVWKAVKAALKEYGREYPHTWVGRLINTIWGSSK